eukprot:351581-Chlamydomonas_euryale.AAC.1
MPPPSMPALPRQGGNKKKQRHAAPAPSSLPRKGGNKKYDDMPPSGNKKYNDMLAERLRAEDALTEQLEETRSERDAAAFGRREAETTLADRLRQWDAERSAAAEARAAAEAEWQAKVCAVAGNDEWKDRGGAGVWQGQRSRGAHRGNVGQLAYQGTCWCAVAQVGGVWCMW